MWIDDDEQRLLEALRQELRLEAFRVGFHDDRDDRGWKEDGVRMVRGWAAVIAPSFDPWAAVAVIDTGAGHRFGAALGTEPRAPLGLWRSSAPRRSTSPQTRPTRFPTRSPV